MKEYLNSFEEVIKENNTSKNGLSSEEAKARLQKNSLYHTIERCVSLGAPPDYLTVDLYFWFRLLGLSGCVICSCFFFCVTNLVSD